MATRGMPENNIDYFHFSINDNPMQHTLIEYSVIEPMQQTLTECSFIERLPLKDQQLPIALIKT